MVEKFQRDSTGIEVPAGQHWNRSSSGTALEWLRSSSENNNQTTAKAKTAVASGAGDKVVCFGEE